MTHNKIRFPVIGGRLQDRDDLTDGNRHVPEFAVAEAKERWRSATGRMTGGKVHVCPTV